MGMRIRLRMWTLLVGAAAALALPMPSWAQLTKYDLESRMGSESHIGKITGHAKDAKADYRRYCVSCHGELGDGNGESFPWVDPKPRDFQLGIFKCRSTPPGPLPTDEDLFATTARVLTAQTCRSGARSLSSSARTWWPGLSISLRAGRMKSRERQSRFRPSRKLPRIASKPGETYLPGCNAGSATAYSVKPMVPPPRP